MDIQDCMDQLLSSGQTCTKTSPSHGRHTAHTEHKLRFLVCDTGHIPNFHCTKLLGVKKIAGIFTSVAYDAMTAR